MNLMPTLMKRELQEHKASFFWLPLGTLTFLILLTLATLGTGNVDISIHSASSTGNESSSFIVEDAQGMSSLVATGLGALETLSDDKKKSFFAIVRVFSSYIFYLLFISMAVFYLTGTLHEERADRSIFFWKSMPVSDGQSVLSKLLCILILVPALFITAIALYQLVLFTIITIAGLFRGAPVASLWLDSGLVGGWIQLIVGYLIQGLWMLPIYGWLLFVSSWATRVPFLVAILAPFIPIMLEAALFQSRYLVEWISSHLKTVALPSPLSNTNIRVEEFGVQDSLAIVMRGDFYLGLIVGAGLIAGAIWFRRLKNDS